MCVVYRFCYFVGRSWLVAFFSKERKPRGFLSREDGLNPPGIFLNSWIECVQTKRYKKYIHQIFKKKQSKHISLKKRWQKSTKKNGKHFFLFFFTFLHNLYSEDVEKKMESISFFQNAEKWGGIRGRVTTTTLHYYYHYHQQQQQQQQ